MADVEALYLVHLPFPDFAEGAAVDCTMFGIGEVSQNSVMHNMHILYTSYDVGVWILHYHTTVVWLVVFMLSY